MYREANLGTQLITLDGGLAGVRQTVVFMQRLAASESATPQVRGAAEKIVRHLPGKNYAAESRAIEAWVKAHMRYTRDGLNTETIKYPTRMLRDIAADGTACLDCDDAAILIASLLLAVGHAPAFEVLGRGRVPHHVRVIDKTTNISLDPTVGEVAPGEDFDFREVYDVVPVAGMGADSIPDNAAPDEVATEEKSPWGKWLMYIMIGRLALKFWRSRK